MIKVFTISPWNKLGPAGAEKSIINLLKGMPYKHYLLQVVIGNKKTKEIEKFTQNGITIYRIEVSHIRFSFYVIWKLIRQIKPNIIYANIIPVITVSFLAKVFAFSKASFIAAVRGGLIDGYAFDKLQLKLFGRYFNKIIVPSKGVAEQLREDLNIKNEKIITIYDPIIETSVFNEKMKEEVEEKWIFESNTPVIIGVGRLEKQKGFEYLIQAVHILSQSKKIKLIIVGEGSQRKYLEGLVKSLKMEDFVFLIGWRDNALKYIKKSSVFVLSSIYEGLPLVVVEAMFCGTPVVVSDCPYGPKETVTNNLNGYIVPSSNSQLLSKAILKILEENIISNRFSENGKKRSMDFVVEKSTIEHRRVFEGLIHQK